MMEEVFIGHHVVEKCMYFADLVCMSYKAGQKEVSRNLAVNGKPRIDQNRQIQAIGRMAEYAACLYLKIDPDRSLNWSAKCDDGSDFLFNGKSFDVKASNHPAASRLIWPVTKNHFLKSAADVFIFARVPTSRASKIGQVVELVGCVTKDRFIKEAITAKSIRGIVDGTLFMDKNTLDDMTTIWQK